MRTKRTKKGRSKTSKTKNQSKKSAKNVKNQQELVCLPDDVNYVRFEVNGRTHFVNIHDNIPVTDKMTNPLNEELEKMPISLAADTELVSLPVAKFRVIDDYEIGDAPPGPTGYIRFIEKSLDELDGEVEYDVDEEDTAWLSIINKKREDCGLNSVEIDVLELLMDRLEKESYFQATVTGQVHNVVDDDAVCCICNDGECQNTNVILFCDMCNLAVHQDCYGVPYIPEGQWLCRRCLQSPSRAVNCVLCPNIDGAFKQTDKGEWAHVVCALWIPEVRFANTVFLEPIDSIELIPAARWRLTCYICKRKGIGACIQCHKSNCYAAFHVTCAQYAALYMNMDTVTKHSASVVRSGSVASHNENSNDSVRSMPNVQSVVVRKIAYCHSHTPAGSNENLSLLRKKREQFSKKARTSLLKQSKTRCNAPGPVIISIPTIPEDRVQEICSLVNVSKKHEFMQRLIAYWTLKRQYRNGVPLLRRLQSQGSCRSADNRQLYKDVDTVELIRQIRYWQCLRQDLERARLLCELVRKRERLKLELIRVSEKLFLCQVNPLLPVLRRLLQSISSKDVHEIFQEPVNVEEVSDYLNVVKNPMDLSTMKVKLEKNEYKTIEDLKSDFELMINNCLTYNSPETIFYKIGIKMKDQCELFFAEAKAAMGNADKMEEIVEKKPPAIDEQMTSDDITNIKSDVDRMTGSYSVEDFEKLLERCKAIPNNNLRKLLSKRVQSRLVRARNKLKLASKSNNVKKTDNKCDDGKEEAEKLKKSSLNEEVMELRSKSSVRSVSRRTAVLLTRKSIVSDNTKNSKRLSSNALVKSEEENERQLRSKKSKSSDEVDGKTGEVFTKYRNSEQIDSEVETDASGYSTCYSRTVSDVEKEDEVKYQLPDKRIMVRKRKNRPRAVVQKRRKR